jgi:hypothetical protein
MPMRGAQNNMNKSPQGQWIIWKMNDATGDAAWLDTFPEY